MDRCMCFFATNVYPEGEGVKRDLIKHGITIKPLKVLANGNVNGIDTSHFSMDAITQDEKIRLCQDLGINSRDFIFVFVGRLVGDKGINELVAAFVRLNDFARNIEIDTGGVAKLLLVGPFESQLDPLKPETIKEIQSNPYILNVGFQTDVRPYFAVSDVLVFPSYREGFPNVVMQAGAMGLPSIVTNINGSNEIIEEGINGVIIPVRDSSSLYQAMQKMVLNENFRDVLKGNSRKRIVDRYERKEVWKALLTEYRQLERNLNKGS